MDPPSRLQTPSCPSPLFIIFEEQKLPRHNVVISTTPPSKKRRKKKEKKTRNSGANHQDSLRRSQSWRCHLVWKSSTRTLPANAARHQEPPTPSQSCAALVRCHLKSCASRACQVETPGLTTAHVSNGSSQEPAKVPCKRIQKTYHEQASKALHCTYAALVLSRHSMKFPSPL